MTKATIVMAVPILAMGCSAMTRMIACERTCSGLVAVSEKTALNLQKDTPIILCEKYSDGENGVLLASLLSNRGDLQSRLGDVEGAKVSCNEAEPLYRKEQADYNSYSC